MVRVVVEKLTFLFLGYIHRAARVDEKHCDWQPEDTRLHLAVCDRFEHLSLVWNLDRRCGRSRDLSQYWQLSRRAVRGV